ncbi:MAG: putative quinol monooxygenase [Methanobacteriaceae archaeon]
MIIVLAKIVSKENNVNNIINEANTLINATRNESGCIEYNLHKSLENENELVFVEKWEDEDSLKSHLETEHFKVFGNSINDFLAKDIDISIFNASEIKL